MMLRRSAVQRVFVQQRYKSTDHLRNYLDGWVGSKKQDVNGIGASKEATVPTSIKSASSNTSSSSSRLVLSGSSYLMPTLRLDRRDDAASLKTKITKALGDNSNSSQKNMLTTPGSKWKVPIVLDLASLVPDGSPHYVAPAPDLLPSVIDALGEFGISVVGVSHAPRELEAQLELPLLLQKGRASGGEKVLLEDIIKMVQEKQAEAPAAAVPVAEPAAAAEPVKRKRGRPRKDAPVVAETPPITPPPNSFVYYGSVRSGQQVAAEKGQALVVIGSVNSGGEVLSDSDIFIFGRLRGRALAGLASEKGRIVATSFDPELVCVADVFTTVDNVTEFGLKRPGEAAMVSLDTYKRALQFEEFSL